MTTLQSNTSIGPDTPITARMSAGEWGKVLALIISCVVSGALYVQSIQGAVADAAREAKAAAADARSALTQAAELKTDLNKALGEIAGQLGYIRGLLEQSGRPSHP
jgi:hypothetical protein